MMNYRPWEEYKNYVAKTFKDFKGDTSMILTYGLAEEVQEFFSIRKQELIKGEKDFDVNREQRVSEIGDILWYIGAMELYFQLPPARYTGFFGKTIQIIGEYNINLLETHSECLNLCGEITSHIVEGPSAIDDIQYSLNKLIECILDICVIYRIKPLECLNASVNKLQKRHPNGFNPNAKKNYQEEYKSTKKFIKENEAIEIIFDLKVDKRLKENSYKFTRVKIKKEEHIFDSGDIITDFFRASEYIADTFKDEDYLLNYSPEFRAYLNDNVKQFWTGYIYKNKILTTKQMMDLMQEKKSYSKVFFAGREARPILLNPEIMSLDDLFLHVGKVINKS